MDIQNLFSNQETLFHPREKEKNRKKTAVEAELLHRH